MGRKQEWGESNLLAQVQGYVRAYGALERSGGRLQTPRPACSCLLRTEIRLLCLRQLLSLKFLLIA